MATKVYLAGPMTGHKQFNFPAFFEAAEFLRGLGYEVLSPAEIDIAEVGTVAMESDDGKLNAETNEVEGTGMTFGDFLARDLKIVADHADCVACLPGWEQSRGARFEVYAALESGKHVYAYVPAHGLRLIEFERAAEIVTPRWSNWATYKEIAYASE